MTGDDQDDTKGSRRERLGGASDDRTGGALAADAAGDRLAGGGAAQARSLGATADKAARAWSFGAVADVYDRGRPGWPAAAIEWLLGPEPLDVLDLGAGTGKLTAALLAAGHRVTALEPSAGMREVLVARSGEAAVGARESREPPSGGTAAAVAATAVGAAPPPKVAVTAIDAAPAEGAAARGTPPPGPRATVIDGRAEEIPLADKSVDAVVAGSAFHWFDREPTLEEISRVLRLPGVFGLLGNRYDTSVDWQRRLRHITSAGMIYRGDHWPRQPELRARFQEVEDRTFAHRMEVDPHILRDYLASLSWVATMPPTERDAHLAAVDEFWANEPELRGRHSATLIWRTPIRRAKGLRAG